MLTGWNLLNACYCGSWRGLVCVGLDFFNYTYGLWEFHSFFLSQCSSFHQWVGSRSLNFVYASEAWEISLSREKEKE